jgi:hypothetical protein
MTAEQDAAHWQTLQQYKQLRAERDRREAMARQWGNVLVSVGELLESGGIAASDPSKLPDKTVMLETKHELSFLYDQIAGLRKELKRAGMEEFL